MKEKGLRLAVHFVSLSAAVTVFIFFFIHFVSSGAIGNVGAFGSILALDIGVEIPNRGSSRFGVAEFRNDRGVFASRGIERYEERDWKMAYLARVEYASSAEVVWGFDVEPAGGTLTGVTLSASCRTFHDAGAAISWEWTCGDADDAAKTWVTFQLATDETMQHLQVTREELAATVSPKRRATGASCWYLRARLRGGQGDQVHVHTQLFRQSVDDEAFPFSVALEFDTARAGGAATGGGSCTVPPADEFGARVKAIFMQLHAGCGDASCAAPFCKSNAQAVERAAGTANETAARALLLANGSAYVPCGARKASG